MANSRIEIADDIVTYLTSDSLTHEFDPLEFLARLSAHIPDKWESTIRYFGVYSHRYRGETKKRNSHNDPVTVLNPVSPHTASKTWAALIKQVYEVDPILCPKCGDVMKIKAFVTDQLEITRLLKNLSINPFRAPPKITGPPTMGNTLEPLFDDLQFATIF